MSVQERVEVMQACLRRIAAALRRADVPFLLAGSAACWVRGGPPPEKDLDVMVRPSDADRAIGALAEAGLRVEAPYEPWLYKAWDGDLLIDVIFGPTSLDVDDALLDRSPTISVAAVPMKVLPLEDVFVTKLLSLDWPSCDYRPRLAIGRAVREQVDWTAVRERTAGAPYASAFLFLLECLGVIPAATAKAIDPVAAGGPVRADAPGDPAITVAPAPDEGLLWNARGRSSLH